MIMPAMLFGLTPQQSECLRAIFAHYLKQGKVIVYGSRAIGNHTQRSDLDLVLKDIGDPDQDLLATIHESIDESDFPYLCDIQYLETIKNPQLLDHIQRIGKVFYDRYAGWKTVKLGDFSLINYGYTAKSSHEVGKFKFLRITDIQDNSVNWDEVPFCEVEEKKLTKVLLHDGDIVFARTGATTGKSFLVRNPNNAVFASYLIRVSVKRNFLIPKFIQYFFQSKEYWKQINEGISGAAQGGFNASKLAELRIPLPPLAEQQRIVAKLDTTFAEIDKAIASAERKAVNLQSLKSAILKQELQSEVE